MSLSSNPPILLRNECYDIAMDCDCIKGCPDILTDGCGLQLTNSVRGQLFMILGSCRNNWMDFPYVNWEKIKTSPINSYGATLIKRELDRAFTSIADRIKVNVSYAKNCFLIDISIPEESFTIKSDTRLCFLDVVNPEFSINTTL